MRLTTGLTHLSSTIEIFVEHYLKRQFHDQASFTSGSLEVGLKTPTRQKVIRR